jgi:hypothetical protein
MMPNKALKCALAGVSVKLGSIAKPAFVNFN